MFFNYLNIVFEVTAHVFRALAACVIILPIAGFLGFVALGRYDGLISILGLMAAIMVVVAVFAELEEAVEEVRSFRY